MQLDLSTVEQYKLFDCIVGSVAYRLNVPSSDVDYRGVFFVPSFVPRNDTLFPNMVDAPPQLVKDKKGDTQYYRLDHFLQLSSNVNPSMIELFWMPEDLWKKMTPQMRLLIDNREAFVSQVARDSFAGYALQQIKKARGQNKWINNPQPETIPSKFDFCKIVEVNEMSSVMLGMEREFQQRFMENNIFPSRPVPLKDSRVDLCHFHASKQESMEGVFRIYDYSDQSPKGVFRGPDQQLVLESIPKEDEWPRFYGFLVFNEQEWKKSVKNWKQYWEWRKNRNEARWVTQESGAMDYDVKNVMHCLRLLWSGINILEKGAPIIRFDQTRHEMLMDVRKGRYQWEEIMKHVDEADKKLLSVGANVPQNVDKQKIDDLYRQIIQMRD